MLSRRCSEASCLIVALDLLQQPQQVQEQVHNVLRAAARQQQQRNGSSNSAQRVIGTAAQPLEAFL
jgi:hypothetical protein